MPGLMREIVVENPDHPEFVRRSSEFMPSGSPVFCDESSIDRLCVYRVTLLEAIGNRFAGARLSELRGGLKVGA